MRSYMVFLMHQSTQQFCASIMFLDIIHRLVHFLKKHNVSETESSLRNVVFFKKMDKTMDNVQKLNTCNNIPSSQTFKSYSESLESNQYSYTLW
jgi:hypothetical protein